MKHKKLILSLAVTLMLGINPIAGAIDSGIVPTVKSDALVAIYTGMAKPVNLSTVRPTMKQGEILVQFNTTMTTTSASDLAYSLGGSVTKTIGKDKISVVSLPKNMSVEQAVRNFSSDPNVVYAQPNYRYYASAAPNDASYGQLWGLNNTGQTITSPSYSTNNPGTAGNDIDAHLAWDVITDCSSVVVAVIDTSINYTHEDLASNMWDGLPTYPNHGWDYVDNDDDPMATDGQIHGGHVAGTIGARGNNSVGTTGVCQRVQIMAVRVLGPNGGSTDKVIQGIDFAILNGAHVINMSLGGPGSSDTAFSNAITNARIADIVVVVAAGNSLVGADNDGGSPQLPCNFTHDNLICVAALDQAYSLASFSHYGATSVDVGAPGTNVLSTWAGSSLAVTTFSDWIASGAGWGSSNACDFGSGPFAMLMNPVNWCAFNGSQYANNLNVTAYKEYDLSGLLGAGFSALAFIDTEPGFDLFNVYSLSTGGNPVSGTTHFTDSGPSGGFATSFDVGLDNCLTTTCSIGYGLVTDATNTDLGVGVLLMDIQKVETASTVYRNIDGTSMASPHVAGIAALVRAYNPQYTYLDTVNAILGGGQATPALAGRTTTGMAANAMGSLAFINAPTGVSATP